MIAETLLLLLGHPSTLFPTDYKIDPAFIPLLHPGERDCLESLALLAWRYRLIKAASARLDSSDSPYMSALCAELNRILSDDYQALAVSTEAKILRKDANFVGGGAFVPLSSLRATFAVWDAPFASLIALLEDLESKDSWQSGPLIDLLMQRSESGVQKVARILTRLSRAVQRVWIVELVTFLFHSSDFSSATSLANEKLVLKTGSMPKAVSSQSTESIAYLGKAIGTVREANHEHQLPRPLVNDYITLLNGVLPEDEHSFDQVITNIRSSVGEWLWCNVLTSNDIDAALDSLANYLLLRNGEFALAFIRELERLKLSRITARVTPSSMIREQDLQLVLLRASLGTSAQQDPLLANIRCHLPSGAARPLLPSLSGTIRQSDKSAHAELLDGLTSFDDVLLGTPMNLRYNVEWPLDLFLKTSDLKIYGALFSYIASLRKTHMLVHNTWGSLSNAQRARRRWTGLSEGGTQIDLQARKDLLRCSWGLVREMGWFLSTLLEYLMEDVVDAEYKRLKRLLSDTGPAPGGHGTHRLSNTTLTTKLNQQGRPTYLDFTTVQSIHAGYLNRILLSSGLVNAELTNTVRQIIDLCERLVAQVERWGGDVLPALLFEGSIATRTDGDGEAVGSMVRERWTIIAEMNANLQDLLASFYEQLTSSMSQQSQMSGADVSRSMMQHNRSVVEALSGFQTTFMAGKNGLRKLDNEGDVRRTMERLLLRMDFNSGFSKPRTSGQTSVPAGATGGRSILKEGGLA